jgi:hypothetical protein
VAELEAENRRLAAKVAELEGRVTEAEAERPKPQEGAFRFGVPDTARAFDGADWKGLGEHLRLLAEGLVTLPAELEKDGKLSPKSAAAIREHNTPLALFAVSIAGELGGTGGNGPFTHPASLANLMRAVLAAAGDPFTPDQEASIRILGEAAVRELQRAAAKRDVLPLVPTIDEVDAKQRFVHAVRGLLTRSQEDLLFRPETEGRVGIDLISPGLIWHTLRDDVTATTREELETNLLKSVFNYAGFDVPDLEAWRWVAHDWVAAIPGALTAVPPKSADALFPRVDVVQAAARAEVEAIERILARGSWSPDQVAGLRGIQGLIQPQLVTSK